MSRQDEQSEQSEQSAVGEGDQRSKGAAGASLHDLAADDAPVVTEPQGIAGLDADEEPQGPDADYWEDPSSVAPGSPGRPLGSSPREQ